jgi:hypothetical protein
MAGRGLASDEWKDQLFTVTRKQERRRDVSGEAHAVEMAGRWTFFSCHDGEGTYEMMEKVKSETTGLLWHHLPSHVRSW